MRALGIDTSTDMLGLGLVDEDGLLGEINIKLEQSHNQRLIPLLKILLRENDSRLADIDLISAVIGPGSFTGLRISLSTIKAFNLVYGFHNVAVSSLELLVAEKLKQPGYWLPVLDARRRRVYAALFAGENDLPDEKSRLIADQALALDNLPEIIEDSIPAGERLSIVGPAVDRYREEFADLARSISCQVTVEPSMTAQPSGGRAAWLGLELFQSGRENDIGEMTPAYLKPPQAEINYRQGEDGGGE